MPVKQRVASRVLYRTRWLTLREDRIIEADGAPAAFAVVERASFVTVLGHVDPDSLLLVRQFRYATGRWLWELPQGSIEPGESPLAAAVRELHEETGWQLDHPRVLCEELPEAGDWATQTFSVITGTAVPAASAAPSREVSEASLSASVVPSVTVRAMAAHGQIVDPPTLAALYLCRLAAEGLTAPQNEYDVRDGDLPCA